MTPQKVIIITPKDIQRLTGLSYKTSTRLHKKIRHYFNRLPHQFITLEDFYAFTGLPR